MKLITAVDQNWAIGKDNGLVFHLKKDLAFFKKTTMNQTVIMGAKTFQSLPFVDGTCLPGRKKVVLSSNIAELAMKYDSCEDIRFASKIDSHFLIRHKEDIVIGGAYTYESFMPYIDTMYITHIHAAAEEADTYLPEVCRPDDSWNKEIIEEGTENGIAYSIVKYTREEQLRIVERLKDDGGYERVEMKELHIDDIFRMFEPDGNIPVLDDNGKSLFKVIGLPIKMKNGNYQVDIEEAQNGNFC